MADSGNTLKDKVAIVTGASSGIGKSIAIALASSGAKVVMAARRFDLLKEIETTITNNGGTASSVKTDVTKRDDVKELVRHAETTFGSVDILINNAGTFYYTLMKNLHEDEWDNMIDVNIKGLTNCIGAVLEGMVKRGSGHIVNMSSDAGRKGFAGMAVYSGTKFYIEGMSQGMRAELAGTGIKVTCIQPGDVTTPIADNNTDKEAKDIYGMDSFKLLEVEDVTNSVLYALTQPDYVAVNEILIQPRERPL